MNSIGRPSGSWNCKSRMTSFTSAITLRAAIVSSLQCMHLLMGTIRREIEYNSLIMLSSPSLPSHQKNVFTLLSPFLNDSLLWLPHSFERLILLIDPLSWALYWVTNSFEHFFGWFTLMGNFLSPIRSKAKKCEHIFEHSKECTYSQEPFFECIYSHVCSFGHFLKGSRSTRTLMFFGTHFRWN